LWCRLASTIGIAERIRPITHRRALLPDGSERYLVDEALLVEFTRKLGGQLLDPIRRRSSRTSGR
jgi:tellurite methyltransferase